MNDKQWIEKVRAIKDPVEMLRVICENEDFFGYDPYYKELRAAMTETAEAIVKAADNGGESHE